MLCSYILSAATPRTLNDNVIVYGYKSVQMIACHMT